MLETSLWIIYMDSKLLIVIWDIIIYTPHAGDDLRIRLSTEATNGDYINAIPVDVSISYFDWFLDMAIAPVEDQSILDDLSLGVSQ